MQYNVFTDFHHASLLNSLILLFEKRLGGTVYRPIGIEWAEKGFWKVYDHLATQQQFLTLNQGYRPIDGTPPLNLIQEVGQVAMNGTRLDGNIYYCRDIDSNQLNKAITLDTFMRLKIDIVIASIPQHIEPFKKLCELHPNHPKLIFQIGNAWTVEAGLAPNIMASAIIDGVPENINFISYHQEFDTDIFQPDWAVDPPQNVFSFVNVFNGQAHLAADWQLFESVEKLMPEWNFKSLGGQCRDGAAHGSQELAYRMKQSKFIWHTKAGGDGYGHIIHNAAAVGRPLIVKKQYYQGKMAEPLIEDGVTSIVIDNLSAEEIVNKIEYYGEQERWKQLCANMHRRFIETVDFDAEAQAIRTFLDNLK